MTNRQWVIFMAAFLASGLVFYVLGTLIALKLLL